MVTKGSPDRFLDVLLTKGQDPGDDHDYDRFHRRIDTYRKHHVEVSPRFENTVSSQNQQQKQDTLLLRHRLLETSETKKSPKKYEKKQPSNSKSGSSVGSNKSTKRQNVVESNEPPLRISSTTGQPSSSTQSKNGLGLEGSGQLPPPILPSPNYSCQSAAHVSELKSNAASTSDFADLDQCAAALEKDAAESFMGEISTEEILNPDVFDELISEISDLNPDLMGNFYLDDDPPPPSAADLNSVTVRTSGAPVNGSCNTTDPFHRVTTIAPMVSSVSHGHHSSTIKVEGSAGSTASPLAPCPANSNNIPIRLYGPGHGFQGMVIRTQGDQIFSVGSQNPHSSIGNPGIPHNEWMGRMNNIPDGSCNTYATPQRHPPQHQERRPSVPPLQCRSGMPQNQGSLAQGAPRMTNNFGQPHDHMMGQETLHYNMGPLVQNCVQQQQLPNFRHHSSRPNSDSMTMGTINHHIQLQQQPFYGNSNNGFSLMKMNPSDSNNSRICALPSQISHLQLPLPPRHQQQQHMFNNGQ